MHAQQVDPFVQKQVENDGHQQIKSGHDKETVVRFTEQIAEPHCNTDVEYKHKQNDRKNNAHL